MGYSLVRISKRQSEVHIFPADFTTQLNPGETVNSGSWVYQVFTVAGTDANPSAILLGTPNFAGNTVTQQLQQGIPGVIYSVVVTVNTSTGRILHIESKLAVRPDDYPADGVYVSYYETSQPYPAYSTPGETIHLPQVKLLSGILQSVIYNTYQQDTIHFQTYIASGVLQTVLLSTSQQDTIHLTTSVVSGTQTTVLVITNQQDTIHLEAAIVSGAQTTVIVNNSQQDTIHLTCSLASGTLT